MTVPDELAVLPQWVVWKLEKRKGKTTKIPYRARDGRAASATDPSDWCSFDEAEAAVRELGMDGVGFVFTPDDPYCGIDIDHCVSESGEIDSIAQDLVTQLGTYTEFSPSGTGVHCIGKGEAPEGWKRRSNTPWGGNLEIYDKGRYFTFTGRPLNGLSINAMDGEITLPTHSDEEVIRRCRDRSKGFAALFDEGDYSDHTNEEGEPDRSRADFALANMIAARSDVPGQIERIMRVSAMSRDKWDTPDTGSIWLYRRAIEPALKDARENRQKGKSVTGDFETDVKARMYMLEVHSEAKSRVYSKDYDLKPLTSTHLGEQMLSPQLDPVYRVESLHPTGGNVLLIAERKSGKSALMLNLLKAVADGTPFLGRFPLEPFSGNVAIFNYEERESHWLRHVAKMNITNVSKVYPLHRRGETILPFWDKKGRQELVQWMIRHEIAYWIMDPAAMAWQGLVDNENDNALITKFTKSLDDVKQEAGIQELVLTHHTGRNGEPRGRGAMRLEDWADALWFLERDAQSNQRSMWADGRDVEVERFNLHWNDWVFTAGPSESEVATSEQVSKDKELKTTVTEILLEAGPDGLSKTKLYEACKAVDVKMGKQRMFDKFEAYAKSAGVIGMMVDGDTHRYFHKRVREQATGSQPDSPADAGTGSEE